MPHPYGPCFDVFLRAYLTSLLLIWTGKCSSSTTSTGDMGVELRQTLLLAFCITSALAYVDFGTITHPSLFEPTFRVPRPHQLPDDVWMRYETFHSHLTAVAPSVRLLRNGSLSTSWSIHSQHQLLPTRTIGHYDLRKRGVFSGDPPIPTCRQCDRNGNPVDNSNSTNSDSGSPSCSIQNYDVSNAHKENALSVVLILNRVSSDLVDLDLHLLCRIIASTLATLDRSYQPHSLLMRDCLVARSATQQV